MAPTSYNSSDFSSEARNGSASSSLPAQTSTTHVMDAQRARYPAGFPPSGLSNANYTPVDDYNMETGQSEYPSEIYTNGDHSNEAPGYEAPPTFTYPPESEYASETTPGEYYYPPPPGYAPQPAYNHEVSIEHEQNGTRTANAEYPDQVDGGVDEPPAEGFYPNQNDRLIDRPHPVSIERWVTEYSPEERIRLGLSRRFDPAYRRVDEHGSMHGQSHSYGYGRTQGRSSGHYRSSANEPRRTQDRSRTHDRHRG